LKEIKKKLKQIEGREANVFVRRGLSEQKKINFLIREKNELKYDKKFQYLFV
jgi:hypothetical protein